MPKIYYRLLGFAISMLFSSVVLACNTTTVSNNTNCCPSAPINSTSSGGCTAAVAAAANSIFPYNYNLNVYQAYPWSILYYYGLTSTHTLGQTFKGEFTRAGEYIDTIEVAYTPQKTGKFLESLPSPLILQLAANVTYRNGPEDNYDPIYEFDPYFILRWTYFPWNNYLDMTAAAAEGVSYDTSVPGIEKNSTDQTGHFLNYLMFETTFALPKYPRLQAVLRIHHRSGAYGLYGYGNCGSNVLGLGIRYLF
jgi:hypothetical protein